MKSQTHLIEVTRQARLLKAFVFGCLGLLLVSAVHPVDGSEREEGRSVIVTRKALRAYPVSYRKPPGGDRHQRDVRQAAPVSPEILRGIPRAKVVRRAPAAIDWRRPAQDAFNPHAEIPARGSVERMPSKTAPKKDSELRPQSRSQPKTSSRKGTTTGGFPQSPSPASLVRRCDVMALEGLAYKFGADDPSSGGLDCSGAVQYLLRQEGVRDVPRTAYTQYQWLKKLGTLNKVRRWTWSKERVAARLRPGDLMFWTGTYNTGKSPNISHVMIYLGHDAKNGKHYMFGASSRRSKGVHGNAVDVYEFVYPRKHGKDNFAGFGRVPGLTR